MTLQLIITFLNSNSGAIQGVTNIIIACFAILSFIISIKALREASSARKDERLPIIRVGIGGPIKVRETDGSMEYILLRIKNVGHGIARNIKLCVADKASEIVRSLDVGKEESVQVYLNSGDDKRLAKLPADKRTITVEYQDIFSRKVSTIAYFEDSREQTWTVFRVIRWDPILP